MIKFNEIQIGDFIIGDFEGKKTEGEVTLLNGDEKQVCIQSGDQEYWFEKDHVFPIPLDEKQLLKLSFSRHNNDDGSVKYMKGAFRLVIPKAGDFSQMEIWYREDRRHNPNVHHVHELQNAYLQMTKVHLTTEAM